MGRPSGGGYYLKYDRSDTWFNALLFDEKTGRGIGVQTFPTEFFSEIIFFNAEKSMVTITLSEVHRIKLSLRQSYRVTKMIREKIAKLRKARALEESLNTKKAEILIEYLRRDSV